MRIILDTDKHLKVADKPKKPENKKPAAGK